MESVENSLTPLQRVYRMLRHYRKEIRYIILYAIVAGLISLSLPLGVQAIIGLIAGGSISASWGVLVFGVIMGALLTGLLRIMQLSIMEHLQRRIFTDAALEFALRIPRLNLEKLRKEHLPEVVNRFFDTTNIQKSLPKLLIDGITAIISIVLSLLVLSFYHPSFVSFSILLIGILSIMLYFTGPSGLSTSLVESKYKYKLAHWLEEVSRVAATFKLAGENTYPVRVADKYVVQYLDARGRHWRILLIQFVSSLIFRVLVLGGYLILGSLLVMNNELNLGQFVASEFLVLFVVDSVEKLVLLHESAYDVLTATEKLGQVTDLPIEEEKGVRMEEFCQEPHLKVELKNLTYQFDDGDEPVIKNLNLVIPAKQKVAITGYSGAGISTLMQILSVIKREHTGALLFNDLPLQSLHLRSLRQHIGDLSSQEDVFKGTILDNITLGREHISVREVVEYCNLTGLGDFVREQPKGLDTELYPGGKNTPGSVVNKILLTRAIVDNPKLLALEKPLSNLVLQDRIRVATLLTDNKRPWTLVCATEDPIMASMCERILVLKAGEIVFDGTHAELLQTEHCNFIFKYNLNETQ
jgi:ABC-type bacteriocin/lantibiotic exporter with double-glycine peptidase domain